MSSKKRLKWHRRDKLAAMLAAATPAVGTRGAIRMVLPSLIDTTQWRRPLDPAKVQALCESITRLGLLQPIRVSFARPTGTKTVQKMGDLVAGAHRLAAWQKVHGDKPIACLDADVPGGDNGTYWGWENARTFRECNGLLLELQSIDENLARAELDAAQHALHTQRRKALVKELAAAERELGKGVAEGNDHIKEFPRPELVHAHRAFNDARQAARKPARVPLRNVMADISSDGGTKIADATSDSHAAPTDSPLPRKSAGAHRRQMASVRRRRPKAHPSPRSPPTPSGRDLGTEALQKVAGTSLVPAALLMPLLLYPPKSETS